MVERDTEWIDSQSAFDDLCRTLLTVDAVALDTEFHREKTYFPHLALLQLQWADRLVLVDPFSVDLAGMSGVWGSWPN